MPLLPFLAESDVGASLWKSLSGAWDSWITRAFVVALIIMWGVATVLLLRGRRVGVRLAASVRGDARGSLAAILQKLGLVTMALSLREFREHLVEQGQRRHRSVRRYLTEEALTADIRLATFSPLSGVTWRALDEMPSWFVGIGILGTFVGVSLALGDVDVQDITGTIPQTIKGLSTAFWVSIMAVGSSLLLQWFTRLVENRLAGALYEVIERMDRAVPAGVHDAVGRDQLALGSKQLEEKARQSKLLRQQLRVKKQQRRLLRSQIQQSESTNATLVQIRDETEQSRVNLQQLLEDLSQRFEHSLNTTFTTHLTRPLESMVTAVTGSAAQAGAVAEESARAFTQEAIRHIGDGLRERFDALGAQIDTFAQRFEHITSALEGSMSATRSVVGEQNGLLSATLTAASRLRQDQTQALEGMSVVPAMVAQLATLSQEIAASIRETGGIHQSQASFHAQVHERQAALHEQVQVDVAQASEAFSVAGEQLGQILSTLVPAVETLSGSLSMLTDRVDAVTTQMDQATERIGLHNERAEKLMENQIHIAGQFRDAFRDGRKVTEGLATVTDKMSSAADKLAETTGPLSETASGFAMVAEQLGTGVDSLQGVTAALGGVAESTVRWADASTRAVGQFQDGLVRAVEGSLSRYDESLSIAVKDLRAAMGELEDHAEQIKADAAKIIKRGATSMVVPP